MTARHVLAISRGVTAVRPVARVAPRPGPAEAPLGAAELVPRVRPGAELPALRRGPRRRTLLVPVHR
jgi:hypothetical protein